MDSWFEVALVATIFAIGNMLIGFVLIVHAWWLPRNGVNGWTGEPKARYYALRGWRSPNSDQPLH